MKLSQLCLVLASRTVAAHTVFTTLFVNDVNHGDGTCIRMPNDPATATDPINDLASNDMACGFNGTVGVARVCAANQSSKLSFLFREFADGSQPGSLDPEHRGPCSVYMKPVNFAINDTATGAGWFKIWDEGYDQSTSQWCTEKLMKNNGILSVNIPSELAGGYYLVRPELLALHQADKTPPNPQFYVGIRLFLFNIWDPRFPYPMVGPAAYKNGLSAVIHRPALLEQTEGLLPEDAVVTNANWWGVEVDSYTTEKGCFNASTACFDQLENCYDTAPPTGSSGCKIWEAKCTEIQTGCKNQKFSGPPNQHANLNPKPSVSYSIPPGAQESSNPNPRISPTPKMFKASILSSSSKSPEISSYSLTTSTPMLALNSTTIANSTPNLGLNISMDAMCGNGQTCLGSGFGPCCSSHGWCGSSSEYCNDGCVPEFGSCNIPSDHTTSSSSSYHPVDRLSVLNNGEGRMKLTITRTVTVFETEASPTSLPSRIVITRHTTSIVTVPFSTMADSSSTLALSGTVLSGGSELQSFGGAAEVISSLSITSAIKAISIVSYPPISSKQQEVSSAFTKQKTKRGNNYNPRGTQYPPFPILQGSAHNVCEHGHNCKEAPSIHLANRHIHSHKHHNRQFPVRDMVSGRCGQESGQNCHGNAVYKCCSKWGWCGDTTDHCGSTCQHARGECWSGFHAAPFN